MQRVPFSSSADPVADNRDLRCPSCGYLLYGLPDVRCPECGFHYDRRAIEALIGAAAYRRYAASLVALRCAAFAVAFALPPGLMNLGASGPYRFGASVLALCGAAGLDYWLPRSKPPSMFETPFAFIIASPFLVVLLALLSAVPTAGSVIALIVLAYGGYRRLAAADRFEFVECSLPAETRKSLHRYSAAAVTALLLALIVSLIGLT